MIKTMKDVRRSFGDRETTKPEVSEKSDLCPEPGLWRCYDGMASEVEVLELLHQLVVTLKPTLILETGCYLGHSTEALAAGCRRNGFGVVWTCDTEKDKAERTLARMAEKGLEKWVQSFKAKGVDLIETVTNVDFAFLDSDIGDARGREIDALVKRMDSGGVIVCHDTGTTHNDVRQSFLSSCVRNELQYVQFDTPRGVSIARVP